MATISTNTLLSLDEYARIMGLNPLNFNSAASPNENTFGFEIDKQPLWFRYSWQAPNQMSHTELATYIQQAEKDIAEFLGFWPAPYWTAFETQAYPDNLRREDILNIYSTKSIHKQFTLRFGKVIGVGERKATLISNESVVYSDEDSDTFNETATITVTTTVTDPKKIKVFFENHNGYPEYEVRPIKSIVISGGTATIIIDSWLLFDRDLYERLPSGEPITINAGNPSNYVTDVDVYEVDFDTTARSARFIWEDRDTSLEQTIQDGYLKLIDSYIGVVEPVPATYNDGWTAVSFTKNYVPNMVQFWYQSGEQSQDYLQGYSLSPISESMKKNIAWLATARMENTFRANNNVMAFVDRLRRVTSENPEGAGTFFLDPSSLTAPFGTKYGELLVFRRLKLAERIMKVGLA